MTEAQEQAAIFERCAYLMHQYPELRLLHAIPNGGSRHPAEAANLKRQGVKSGVPDMCLPVAHGGYHGLYIELKRRDGGRLSEHQREWLKALTVQGYKAIVCRGADAAMKEILNYVKEE